MKKEEESKKFRIQTFGDFSISGEGKILDDAMMRSGMLTKFMAYLVCNSSKLISSQELMDVLWGQSETENPAGALKNLVYRMRSVLKKNWKEDFILTGHGTYHLNENLSLEIDAEQFERCIKAAEGAANHKDKIYFYKEAVELYQGSYLPGLSGEYWVITLATYYESRYLQAVKALAELLEQSEKYAEMTRILGKALQLEPLDEDLYCMNIHALIKTNKQILARERYHQAVDMLYENLGVSPSQKLRNVYQELLTQDHGKEMSIDAIQLELNEEEKNGAFFCEYIVFQKLWQLEKRRSERFGISEFLMLVTIEPMKPINENTKKYLNLVNEAMQNLRVVLNQSLRSGDVVTRYSGSQYLVLLPTCQFETAQMVRERVRENFAKVGKKLKLEFSLKTIGY